MSDVSDLYRSWIARLRNDAWPGGFVELVGSDSVGVRLRHRRIVSLIEKPADDTRIVTWQVITQRQLSHEPPRLELQSDIWVAPASGAGGLSVLEAIDARMLALLGEESAITWLDTTRGIYVSCVTLDYHDPPEEYWLRRRRDWELALA